MAFDLNHAQFDKSTLLKRVEAVIEAKKQKHQTEPTGDQATDINVPMVQLKQQYQLVADIQSQAFSQKHSPATPIYQSSDLLWAAAVESTEILETILQQPHINIDVRGKTNQTPLHVAVIMENVEAVQLLLNHGANPCAKAYGPTLNEGVSPLELAVQADNEALATLLYPQTQLNLQQAKELFLCAIEQGLNDLVQVMIADHVLQKFAYWEIDILNWNLAMAILEHLEQPTVDIPQLAEQLKLLEYFSTLVGTVTIDDPYIDFGLPPIGIYLSIEASFTDNPHIHRLLMDTYERLSQIDGNNAIYLQAKALSHIVPVEGTFDINYNPVHPKQKGVGVFEGEGFNHHFAIPILTQSISRFMAESNFSNPTLAEAFKQTLVSFELTSALTQAKGLQSTAQAFFDAYEKGQTIILPTGWEGHAIDLVLNKNLGLAAVANNGSSYWTFDSGASVFQMHLGQNLSPELIHEILMNESPDNFELITLSKLGCVELTTLKEYEQITGNCAWQSNETALEASVFFSLIEQGLAMEHAAKLAHQSYLEWDQFQTLDFVEQYFANDPRVDADFIEAMIKTQAYLINTHDWHVLSQDPVAQVLTQAYDKVSEISHLNITLDYDPFAWDGSLSDMLNTLTLNEKELALPIQSQSAQTPALSDVVEPVNHLDHMLSHALGDSDTPYVNNDVSLPVMSTPTLDVLPIDEPAPVCG